MAESSSRTDKTETKQHGRYFCDPFNRYTIKISKSLLVVLSKKVQILRNLSGNRIPPGSKLCPTCSDIRRFRSQHPAHFSDSES